MVLRVEEGGGGWGCGVVVGGGGWRWWMVGGLRWRVESGRECVLLCVEGSASSPWRLLPPPPRHVHPLSTSEHAVMEGGLWTDTGRVRNMQQARVPKAKDTNERNMQVKNGSMVAGWISGEGTEGGTWSV